MTSRRQVARRRAARNLPPEVRQVIAVMAEIAIRERRRVRAADGAPESEPTPPSPARG